MTDSTDRQRAIARNEQLVARLVRRMQAHARSGIYRGLMRTPQERRFAVRARQAFIPASTSLMYTRDIGHHTSGWWKNPDYERCWHLSLHFFDPAAEVAETNGVYLPLGRCGPEPAPFDTATAAVWARLFFGDLHRWLWIEPPYSPKGKLLGVHHYRLFCDQHWQPILPRGEVYSRDRTPAHWRSWSELHGDDSGVVHAMGEARP